MEASRRPEEALGERDRPRPDRGRGARRHVDQQLLDRDRHEALLEGDLVAAVELEVPLAPVQELLEQPVGLEPQRLEELGALDEAPLHQQIDQPAAGRLVLGDGPREVAAR